MARLFVAHVEGGKQDPMAGVADAIEERRRRLVEEQVAQEQLALQKTGLDLERQSQRLKRWEIAQQGVRQAAELESRERIAAAGEAGALQRTVITETGETQRLETQQEFAAGEAQKARDFEKEGQDLQRQFQSAETAKDRAAAAEALDKNIAARASEIDKEIAAAEKQGDAARASALQLQRERLKGEAAENKKNRTAARKEARAERKAQMERLQKQIDSAEKLAQNRIDSEIAQLDKTIEADLDRLNLQLQDAKAARDDARAADATKQIRQIEADRAAQVRAIQANKDQYQSEAASKASQQLRQLQHEEKQAGQAQRFQANQRRLDREFGADESQKDRDARIAEIDAQIAAAREEGDKTRENALRMQRDRLGAEREMQTERLGSAADLQGQALQAERDNLQLKLDEARREGDLNRQAQLDESLRRIDAQMQLGEMQYGMPGGMAQDTVRTLDAQVESLDRIFDNMPEGQRPPQHVRESGKQALMDAREAILNARTRQEYNAAVTNAGALYQQYQQEMESAGQAVFTSRQTDRYNSLMEWASGDVGREYGITEARLAEVVTGDPAKRSEDISNLVKMKRGAEAFRRGELALEALEDSAKERIEALEEAMGPQALDGSWDRTKVSPVDRLAADAIIGMNDVNLSMTERAAAAQTLIRYANMTDADRKIVDLTLESQRQEQAQLDLERTSGWVRSALAGPDGEYSEQDIMSSDFQDRLVALAAGSAGPNKRGIAAAASKALSIITEQDYASLGAGGYRQLWSDLGAALDPRVLQQLGREMSAVDMTGPSPAAPSGRVGQMLSGMRDRLTKDPESTDD